MFYPHFKGFQSYLPIVPIFVNYMVICEKVSCIL